MFSRRTEWEFAPNRLSAAAEELRRKGERVRDWTLSNPTVVGIPAPSGDFLGALASPAVLRYNPDPRGMRSAREAVARSVSHSSAPVDPDAILLTSSSSESYSHLFRLFCEPGDEILIPTPGYPLFADLARLHDVRVVPYRLRYDGAWHLDRDSLRRALGPRTRGIVAVHPGNPTGAYHSKEEREFLGSAAIERGIPIISDEVFRSFSFDPVPPEASFLSLDVPLVAVLGGLSKLAALPQLKLGWIVVGGKGARVREAMERLEMMGDTFLSVNTPVQLALPAILDRAGEIGGAFRNRIAQNLRAIREGCAGTPISLLSSQGGWNAVLRLPGKMQDEEWALELLQQHGVLTYPGHFFDLEGGSYLVVSLIVPEGESVENMKILRAHVAAHG